jgi:hypothetical protein
MDRTELERAYRATTYVVDHSDGAIALRIGEPCPRLDALLAEKGVSHWAFVTAWNPGSEKISNKNNKLRNVALRAAVTVAGHAVFDGRGVPDRGDWAPEESLLVLGIDAAAATALGRRHGQRAIVSGRAGGCAELHWCGGDAGRRMPA